MGNGVSGSSRSADGKTIYLWNWIWPGEGTMGIGGFATAPRRIYLLKDGTEVQVRASRPAHNPQGPAADPPPDPTGVTVLAMEFDEEPVFHPMSYYPQLSGGRDWAGDDKI